MPRVSTITKPGSVALGAALPLLTSWTNPVSAAIAAGIGLIGLVDKIGQGRKTADTMTENGGPQDIINRQLAAISSSRATAEEKAQATDRAWTQFLEAANKFAAQGPTHAKVARQAIYQTPELTNTVQSMLGKNPLDASYLNLASSGLNSGDKRRNEQPVTGTLLSAAVAGAAPFVSDYVRDRVTGKGPGGTTPIPTQTPGQFPIPKIPGGLPLPDISNLKKGTDYGELFMQMLPFIISGSGDLYSAITGSKAAKEAAEIEAAAANRATDLNREMWQQGRTDLMPWLQTGQSSLAAMSNLMGLPSSSANPYASSAPYQTRTPSTPLRASRIRGAPLSQAASGGR